MKIVKLIDITLHNSSVSEAAHSEWVVGTTYTADSAVAANTVYVTLSEDTLTEVTPHEIYLSTAADNIGNYPSDSPTKWTLVGCTNRWEMFDGYVNTTTDDTSDIAIEIDSSDTDCVGLFNLQGAAVTLTQLIETEMATGGDCAADNFTKGTGWTHDIGDGEYDCSGAQVADTKLYEDMSTVSGKDYLVKFTVSNYTAGNVAGMAGGTAGTDVAADGDYAQAITAGAAAEDGVIADEDFIGSVDDISVRRISSREVVILDESYIVDYYEYFFSEFLYKADMTWEYGLWSSSRLRVEIATQGGTVACGMVALGKKYELGRTRYDVKVGIEDYSKKDTDTLGRTYLSQGVYAKTLEFDMWLDHSTIDLVNRRLIAVRGEASILDANNPTQATQIESMIAYGFFEYFQIVIPGLTISKCSITYQGII